MPKTVLPPHEALYPVPVVLVSCLDKASNEPNIITIAWCGVVCSTPPLISISIRPTRYSHKIISESMEFVVNIPKEEQLLLADSCGMKSGIDVNKFELCGFTAVPSTKISAPMIKECPVNIECRVKEVLKLGSHDMFISEVLGVHADSDLLTDNGNIDFSRARPFVYNQGEYWGIRKAIGAYGCSRK